MSQLPCAYCDAPIPLSEAERTNLCPVCARPLTVCRKYRLKELLSKSDSDRVYRAVRDGDNQEVAVKVLLARDDDWAAISEFERIARTLGASKNRAAPQIFDSERGGHGRLIMVRELCQGQSLEGRLSTGQRPNLAAVKEMLDALLSLLVELHAATPPLLHRDIRPGNILFRKANNWAPVLVDFNPSGAGTTALDLFALGKSMQAAGATSEPVVQRLADVRGSFGSAKDALAALRGSSAAPVAPLHRPALAPPPRRKSEGPRTALIIVLCLFVSGFYAYWKRRQHSWKTITTTAQKKKTTPDEPISEFGDATTQRYRRECDSGKAGGCYSLGWRYENGKTVAKSDVRAAALYRKACDMGELMGCNNLAVLHETGRGVEKNAALAAQLYTRACDGDDWLSCRNLGFMYSTGAGVKQDVPRAIALYQKACDHDEVKGCYNLGVIYENGKPGIEVDFPRALKLYTQACDAKDWEGCTNAGWLYASGHGTDVDVVKARELYFKACDHDDARGCNNLGVVYEKGRSVPMDLSHAFELYQKACDGDDSFGCTNLGFFYENGKGIDKDGDRATRLYQKACTLGYDKGCGYLIDMCKAPATRKTGLMLLQQACEGGDSWSCEQLKKVG